LGCVSSLVDNPSNQVDKEFAMQIVIIGNETFIEFENQQEADATLELGNALEIHGDTSIDPCSICEYDHCAFCPDFC
jgi:hypothetical protein